VPELVAAAGLDATSATCATAATDPEYRYDPERTVGLLAGALARLHDLAVPAGAGPVLAPARLVARARAAVAAGLTVDGMSAAYSHMDPSRLVEVLADGEAAMADLWMPALTHGSPTLQRLQCVDGAAQGFDRWGDAAVSDPYRDLAVAAQDVAATLGPMLVPVLFERYGDARPGYGAPDPVRVDWYVLAAQFGQ